MLAGFLLRLRQLEPAQCLDERGAQSADRRDRT
jgi:hypothetical protein